MMWSVLLQPVVLAAVERQGEALGWLPSPLGWRPSMALQTRQKRRRSRVRDTAAGRRRCGYLAENLALTDRWGADVDTWGADSPGAALTDEGQARFRPATWSWPASQIGENAWFYASFPQMMWTSLGISALRYWHLRGATT